MTIDVPHDFAAFIYQNALMQLPKYQYPQNFGLLLSGPTEEKLSLLDREVNRITLVLNLIQGDEANVLCLALRSIARPPP